MALDFATIINTVNEMYTDVVHDVWLPTLYNICFKRRGSELMSRLPKNGEGVNGLKVKIDFVTEMPWSWGAMTEHGYTPTGAKFDFGQMEANLGCHAANALVSLHQMQVEQDRWPVLERQLEGLSKTFPYYMRALLWASQNSYKAVGKVASVSDGGTTTTVTLDNVGLSHTATLQLCLFLERGQWLQAINSSTGAKIGTPFKVTSVQKRSGTFTLLSAEDPGLADDVLITFSDSEGLDTRYSTLFPSILDVIDDDNTFQGVDRSTAGNEQFQAYVDDQSSTFPDRRDLDDFLAEVGYPKQAFCNRKFLVKWMETMWTTWSASRAGCSGSWTACRRWSSAPRW